MSRLLLGAPVKWNDRQWIVNDMIDLETVRLKPLNRGRTQIAPISELRPAGPERSTTPQAALTETQRARCREVCNVISPLALKQNLIQEDIQSAATELFCSRATVYRYINMWRDTRDATVFLRKGRNDKGIYRIDARTIEIAKRIVKKFYLVEERPTIEETWEQAKEACDLEHVPKISKSTLIRIIDSVDSFERESKRKGKKKARERLIPYSGSFPGANFPLAVVQIDHTPADVILLDEIARKPIGRAYLTIVLDVCTRMICGFHISLDEPGATNAAMALTHAMLPKREWLQERQLPDATWPIYGIPRKVYADNAKEFRGTAISRGCEQYGITLENRPKGIPNYGGHVERAFRTFMRATQRLKGSTFSNVIKKIDYDSEKKARMTLKEYERWFTIFLCYRYHVRQHAGTGYPPLNLYGSYIIGSEDRIGIGHPEPIKNPKKLLLDFLPYKRRAVHQSGVLLDQIWYWDDILRYLIKPKDDKEAGMKYIFAYDPRDISKLHFLDPRDQNYYEIPYRDRSHPIISIWELRAARKQLAKDPSRTSNEAMIFEGIRLMREVEEIAVQRTSEVRAKSSRRMQARRAEWQAPKPSTPIRPDQIPTEPSDALEKDQNTSTSVWDLPIEPFDLTGM
jgi:putative transposase